MVLYVPYACTRTCSNHNRCLLRSAIVVHTIRNLLESDHTLVIRKVDCRNTFNAIHKDPILEVVAAEAPALLAFADFLIN